MREPGFPESERIDRFNPENETRHKFKNLLELTHLEKSTLINRIAENNNTIRIVIHPFEESERRALHPYPEHQSVDAQSRRMDNALLSMVGNSKRNTPIIIFEQESKISSTEQKLLAALPDNTNSRNKDIYIVPTYESDPEPKIADQDADFPVRNLRKDWARLKRELGSLGVKKIIIGGEYLMSPKDRISPRYSPDGELAYGCVNVAEWMLANNFDGLGFDIERSNLSYPSSRKYLGPKPVEPMPQELWERLERQESPEPVREIPKKAEKLLQYAFRNSDGHRTFTYLKPSEHSRLWVSPGELFYLALNNSDKTAVDILEDGQSLTGNQWVYNQSFETEENRITVQTCNLSLHGNNFYIIKIEFLSRDNLTQQTFQQKCEIKINLQDPNDYWMMQKTAGDEPGSHVTSYSHFTPQDLNVVYSYLDQEEELELTESEYKNFKKIPA